MASTKKRGFSVLELTVAITIGLILAAITDAALQPVFRQQRVNDAYNLTISSLRRAHDAAAADMRVYEVTFTAAVPNVNGGTITVTQADDTVGNPVLFTAVLPMDVTYHVETGIPTSQTTAPTTPDGFGTGANTFDFDQPPGGVGGSNVIYFYPDGTAEDALGNINNGVVYMGVIGQLQMQRAVTLWGYTGRVRGWHLYNNAGKWTWSQQ